MAALHSTCAPHFDVCQGKWIDRVALFLQWIKGDLYARPGRTMEWDTAAPYAILEAAGGSVRTVDGHPLMYGKPRWENTSFVCTGRQ